APQYWTYPGFIEYPSFQWSLGETLLSRLISGPEISFLDAFPGARNPYVLTYGTSPSMSESVLPSGFRIDDSTVRTDIAQLEFVTATQTSETYKLVPVGVGEYTLKGSIRDGINKDRQTSTIVKVQPAATNLSSLQPLTLTTDSRRVEVLPPQSSRPGTATFTYQIAGSGSTIARVVTEAGRYYVEPVGTPGTTTLTITQAAAGNYAEGATSVSITVNAGAAPINAFLDNITRVYGNADVLVPLPDVGFTPDQAVGGPITFASTNPSVASTVMDNDTGKIRIGFTHAGVTTLTVKQGTSTATTTITVTKGTPSLQYTGGTIALQQGQCRNNPDMVGMPLLNAGSTGTGALYSTSDGAITYSILNTNLMTFGTRINSPTPYNEGYLYGVQPGNSISLSGDFYTLTVNQAETADYQSASITVPNAFFIKGLINTFPDYVYSCGPV
ncbi:MAG: hypothetical protein O9327_21795, partial [Polaromonas sp.]|nr:hypothetical protein [Polaromonas sp.]